MLITLEVNLVCITILSLYIDLYLKTFNIVYFFLIKLFQILRTKANLVKRKPIIRSDHMMEYSIANTNIGFNLNPDTSDDPNEKDSIRAVNNSTLRSEQFSMQSDEPEIDLNVAIWASENSINQTETSIDLNQGFFLCRSLSIDLANDSNIQRESENNLYATHEERTSIIDLNNDCLTEIINYLNPINLLAIAESCSLLRDIACQVVARSQNKPIFIERFNMTDQYEWFLRLLRNLGCALEKWNICYDRTSDIEKLKRLVSLSIGYCNHGSKNNLILRQLIGPPILSIVELVPRLTFCYCRDLGAMSAINCVKLKLIDINANLADCFNLKTSYFPNLYSLYIKGYEQLHDLRKFMSRLRYLKRLKMINCGGSGLQYVSDHRILEKLSIISAHNLDIMPLVKLKCLRKLILNIEPATREDQIGDISNDLMYTKFLNKFGSYATLEHLELNRVVIYDGLGSAIRRFKCLQILKFNDMLKGDNKIFNYVPNLSKLKILGFFGSLNTSINIPKNDIVDIVTRLPTLIELQLRSLEFVLDDVTYMKLVQICCNNDRYLRVNNLVVASSPKPISEKNYRKFVETSPFKYSHKKYKTLNFNK